ncbi:DUF2511 domain-containing protein [Shewanella baltica]|uniref:DUF2511 domain-containing protein n=1 Tax=Shewanella baltica TaxID=62322 RepID=UPI0039AFEB5A
MYKTIIAFSILALSLAATAKEIQQYSYGESWPFTVESGEIACYEQAVFFIANDIEYAVNGIAISKGYVDITSIWKVDSSMLEYQQSIAKQENKTIQQVQDEMGGVTRVNINPILQEGLKLCK